MEAAFDDLLMRRCFDLARQGAGRVKTNPLVGAVLVADGKVIGEGYHARFGGPHAEVNALRSVAAGQRRQVPGSTLYVSLEPCRTHGKTPPCSDLILRERIGRVKVSCLDPSPEMSGQSLRLLAERGVQVESGILEAEGRQLIAPFRTCLQHRRPYVILKYARSRSGYFAPLPAARQWITTPAARRLVHKWRSECDGILVGYRTARVDDPQLSSRFYPGPDPLRIILDPQGNLPPGLKVLSDGHPTLWFRAEPQPASKDQPVAQLPFPEGEDFLPALLEQLPDRGVSSLLVEGGARTLELFIRSGMWDEARVLTGPGELNSGIPAPVLPVAPSHSRQFGSNRIDWFFREDRNVKLALK